MVSLHPLVCPLSVSSSSSEFFRCSFGLAATGPQVLPQNEETAPNRAAFFHLQCFVARARRSFTILSDSFHCRESHS
ncbi:hypothetical protein VIGAN_UM188500 [Vigna angularis var. angularis]|uniref:Uncharacterized protein n=1 Tax=Vigna angularis var. angularis TaxID=157739 RepID=A0A0S3TFE5_PHAAN|nr:hypothetical protein VIGAN_UM188500 [Vigna angularis var. angularis]